MCGNKSEVFIWLNFLQNPRSLSPADLAHLTGWSRRKKSQRSCGQRRLKTAWPASASRASTWLGCTIMEPPSLPQPPHPPWPPPRHRADTPPLNLILEAPHAIWSAWGWWHWYVWRGDPCPATVMCFSWPGVNSARRLFGWMFLQQSVALTSVLHFSWEQRVWTLAWIYTRCKLWRLLSDSHL